MKITTFNPQIITKNAESIMKLFEELGFIKRHDQEGIGDLNVEGIRMKSPEGYYLDISCPEADFSRDMVGIRMNVDDFDEAYLLLLKHGFKNFYGDKTVDTKTSRSAMMISPTGFGINLIEHKK
ncbi:MAG: hypothetical protein IJH94_02220 [Clostridia bacterium]|nr:hypothetical protein [Clostridia bacterium]